ncbi:MAG: hypothetical protein LBK28_02610, partial [Propionibacteriaceae bacterium]|nr:hypothetical protein [Propionibacteriaceae bacterium]
MSRSGVIAATAVLGLIASLFAGSPAVAVADDLAVNHNDKTSVSSAYLEVLQPAKEVPIGWTGSKSPCLAGAPSAAAQQATLTAVNWFRNFAGLDSVVEDAAWSAQ